MEKNKKLLWKSTYSFYSLGETLREPHRYKIEDFGNPSEEPIVLDKNGKLTSGGIVKHNFFRTNI